MRETPSGGSVGVRASRAGDINYKELSRKDKPLYSLQSQFSKASNHHRGDIPDRFFTKAADDDTIIYAHAFCNTVNVKARNQSKKNRDVDYLVFDVVKTEERIANGRPAYLGRYRNGEYFIV